MDKEMFLINILMGLALGLAIGSTGMMLAYRGSIESGELHLIDQSVYKCELRVMD